MIRKPGFSYYPIKLGLTSKVGDVKFAFADRFYVRQSGPHEMPDAGILGGAYGSGCLLQFVRSALLEVGYQKNTPCAPSNADARVSGRFKSASTTSSASERCLAGLRVRARTLN